MPIFTPYMPPIDPVQRLNFASEALQHIARNMPEKQGGVAHLMHLISKEVQDTAEVIDDSENVKRR